MATPSLKSLLGFNGSHSIGTIPAASINTVTASPNPVQEGNVITWTVATTNVPDGTSLNWATTVSNDPDTTPDSGTVTINSNTGTFTYTAVADGVVEGDETKQVTVSGVVNTVFISKTSSTVTFQDLATGTVDSVTGPIDVDEGNSATFTVATTNIPNGTSLGWAVMFGGNANPAAAFADFSSTSGAFTINNNAGTFSVPVSADGATEGAEDFRALANYAPNSSSATSGYVRINDTSNVIPAVDAVSLSGTPAQLVEGASRTIDVSTSNIPNGTVLNWAIVDNTTSAADFNNTTGTVTINSNAGTFIVDPTSDGSTEGSEFFAITVSGTVSGTAVTRTSAQLEVVDPASPTYAVVAPTDIDEGSAGTMQITTTNVANSTTLYYTLSDSNDLATSSGSFTINNNSASFTVTPTADTLTEGQETGTIKIRTGSVGGTVVATDTFIINDTSTSPTYTLSAPSQINEGSSGTVNVATTNVANGTTLYWQVSTGDTPADFATGSGTITINSNAGSFSVLPTADATTEGDETATITLRTGSQGGTIVDSTTFTIKDTSTTPVATYSVVAPTTVNEGSAGTMTVTTTNVANGTTLYYSVVPAGDFNSSSGSFTINSNAGSFTLTPTADSTTEGTETATVSIRTGSVVGTEVANDTFDIGDVSIGASYTITAPNDIDEGSAGTFNVQTAGVANGTTLYWTIEPSADFATASGSVTVNSNAGSFTATPTADNTTEGTETGTISLRTGSTAGTVVATDTFDINDTSVGPTYAVVAPTEINEGSAGTMTVTTTNVANGTTLYWTITPNQSDFAASSGNFTVNSNSATFTVTPNADQTTEGDETSTINIKITSTLGTTVATDTFVVKDTSQTPGPSYAVVAPANISEGTQSAAFNVTTTNVANGTTLYWSATPTSDFTNDTGSFTISANAGTFTLTADADATTEGTEGGTISIRTGSAGGPVVATDTFDILDTSLTASIDSVTPAANNIDEGSALTFTVATTGISDGQTLSWAINNVTSSNADFAAISGTFNTLNDGGTFTVTPVADATTEGAETFTVTVTWTVPQNGGGENATSPSVTINDTSQTASPTYTVAAPTSINEGSAGTFNVTTQNVSNGTTLYYTLNGVPSGGTTQAADFGGTYPSGSFTVNSNAGSFTATPTADSTTEGTETAQVEIRTGSTSGTIVATDTFNVNDTSTTPPAVYIITAPTSINEGSAGTFNITTAGVAGGTTLYWQVTTGDTPEDFATTSGSVTISIDANSGEGVASFTATPTADTTTEGSETATVNLRTGSQAGSIVATDTFTINDTSTTPAATYSVAGPALDEQGSGGTAQDEDITVSTTNVPNGTTLYWNITPTAEFDTTSGSFTVTSNVGIISVRATRDFITEGTDSYTINVRTGSTSGTIVATNSGTIADTAKDTMYNFVVQPNFYCVSPSGGGFSYVWDGVTLTTQGNSTSYTTGGYTYTPEQAMDSITDKNGSTVYYEIKRS